MSSVARYNIEAVNDGGDLFTESHKSSDGAWVRYEDHAAALAAERAKTKVKTPVRPRSEYHEDCGPVAWWVDDFCESLEEPYIGSPLDTGFDESYQWWSELPDFAPMVEAATSALDAAKEQK